MVKQVVAAFVVSSAIADKFALTCLCLCLRDNLRSPCVAFRVGTDRITKLRMSQKRREFKLPVDS